MKEHITTIGAGVSGLSTATVLQEAGYRVRLLAETFPPDTNSDRAGAIWFPTRVGPADKVGAWGRRSYDHFQTLSLQPGTGVSMVDLVLLEAQSTEPTWASGLPPGAYREARPGDLPPCHRQGFVLHVPFIEPGPYLAYLLRRFRAAGGQTETGRIERLAAGRTRLVNCTGMGARTLAQDPDLIPVHGRTVRVSAMSRPAYLVRDEDPGELTYVFSRRGDTLLGGTATPRIGDDAEGERRGILARSAALVPELAEAKVLGYSEGIRPYRPAIRLEMDAAGILHNYGHGGAGFTVSWGCAEEVLALLEDATGKGR